jgi:hypothetical protein
MSVVLVRLLLFSWTKFVDTVMSSLGLFVVYLINIIFSSFCLFVCLSVCLFVCWTWYSNVWLWSVYDRVSEQCSYLLYDVWSSEHISTLFAQNIWQQYFVKINLQWHHCRHLGYVDGLMLWLLYISIVIHCNYIENFYMTDIFVVAYTK